MKTFEQILSENKQKLADAKKNIATSRVFLVERKTVNGKVVYLPMLTFEQFKELIKVNAEVLIAEKKKNRKYIIAGKHEKIIYQLYLYSVGSAEFSGDIYKGIYLSGNNGTGKTILLKSFIKIITDFSAKIVTSVHSLKLAGYLKEHGEKYLDKRPLYIEDLGKETAIINDFGTKRMPIVDVFSVRYNNGAWTFTCCNYKLETIEQKYSKTISNRFLDMFNFFELTGECMRGDNIK